MNFYYETLDRCIEHFGGDHENAERYLSWILDNIKEDVNRGTISAEEYDRFMDIITDLF